ncbi:MAG: hypothetical protein R3C16_08070 [Hyphomonadaceae bacterium]
MTAAIDRMYWLNAREHAALLMHAVCGDWLAPPDANRTWFAPTRVSRGERVLLLCYESERATMGLCAVLPKSMSVEWMHGQRAQLTPRGAEAKWAHFVSQLGRFDGLADDGAQDWSESTVAHEGKLWRARRARHPSPLMDRLLVRDRTETEDYLQAVLCSGTASIAALDVGESPRAAQRANVGDKRTERS